MRPESGSVQGCISALDIGRVRFALNSLALDSGLEINREFLSTGIDGLGLNLILSAEELNHIKWNSAPDE
jgi:hypothetical protein